MLECSGDDPLTDEWVELGKMKRAAEDEFSFEAFSLDATVFENKGEYYYVWAEKVGVGKMISNLYIAKMESGNQLKTVQVLLTTPDYDWERKGFWVNEGPAVIHHDGKMFLTYSASETGVDYCVGMLSIDEDADILDPRLWKKERYPVLKTCENWAFTDRDTTRLPWMKMEMTSWSTTRGRRQKLTEIRCTIRTVMRCL